MRKAEVIITDNFISTTHTVNLKSEEIPQGSLYPNTDALINRAIRKRYGRNKSFVYNRTISKGIDENWGYIVKDKSGDNITNNICVRIKYL